MPDFISTDELSNEILDNLPPLKTNKAIDDAVRKLIDTIITNIDHTICNGVEDAVRRTVDARPDLTLGSVAGLNDVSGCEIGAMLSEGGALDRANFLRGFVDRLDPVALGDLHSELIRR